MWMAGEKEETKRAVDDSCFELYRSSAEVYPEDLGDFLRKLWTLSPPQTPAFESNKEIVDRIRKYVPGSDSYDDLLERTLTARYTRARIRRAMLHLLFQTAPLTAGDRIAFVQFLAANKNGLAALRDIEHKSDIEILTKPGDYSSLGQPAAKQAAVCARADELYAVLGKKRTGDRFLRCSPFVVR